MRKAGGPTLLAVIPQCPLDPASGAARSTRSVCELLAENGWEVSFAATTGSESGSTFDAATLRQDYQIGVTTHSPDRSLGRRHVTFSYRDVSYRLLDTQGYTMNEARVALAADMDTLVFRAARRSPDVLITYGSSEDEVRRRAELRKRGTRVVFFLRNASYFHSRSFAEVDAILTPSQFLSDFYWERSGVHSSHLPPRVCPEEVLAPCVEPVFSTFVNPSPEKGLGLFLSILEMAAAKRPEIPFLVVESRGSGQLLWDAGRGLGIQLKKANLHIVRNTPRPREIYSVTRVLLVPSMAADAGPRVIPEAQLNGIPVIASDCCGLARVAGFGGFVQPIEVEPGDIHRSAAAEAWFGLICRLYDDSAWYGAASRRAREAVDHYRTGETDRAYLEFFQRVLGG